MRFGLPALEWMLEIGTLLMRTESELVLKSRRVAPGRLLEAGFAFAFPEWPPAARELVARSRANMAVPLLSSNDWLQNAAIDRARRHSGKSSGRHGISRTTGYASRDAQGAEYRHRAW